MLFPKSTKSTSVFVSENISEKLAWHINNFASDCAEKLRIQVQHHHILPTISLFLRLTGQDLGPMYITCTFSKEIPRKIQFMFVYRTIDHYMLQADHLLINLQPESKNQTKQF